ncbi:Cdc15p [Rhizophagus irregularis DAOM 197198w]|uniref:Cdc15p n=2 Tax=Rhizophagus irregularis TaxID=588596 RepID=A0A015IAB7_RHIIW|nr:Cdc15p [Rhizophagus irregularis DAOM 197198w]
MELVNTNNESSFDPTPRLKSSPIPIKFISFNENDENCVYCGEKYIKALFCWQKYCKKCLSRYINDMSQLNHVTDYNIYLDVYIYTMDLECSEHEISRTKVPQNIQECCGNCLRILCFKQVNGYNIINYDPGNNNEYNKVIESEKDCKLCGKSLYQGTDEDIKEQFKLCSDCYIISSECIESTLVKKKISIVYLPWWHNNSTCDICNSKLTFTSDCQKYCIHCYLFYIGCRYCLTTNIFFGPACQSQCKKCKKISSINIDSNIDGFAFNNIIYDNLNKLNPEKTLKNIDKYFRPVNIIASIFKKVLSIKTIKWIPYSQFTDVKEITKGGYGIIYKATWLSKNENVILKRFENSKNDDKYFLNELKSIQHCFLRYTCHIIETYGFTKDPKLEDYIIVMKYASDGDLHKHLQKNFTNITWNSQKQLILWQISEGLETIHKKKFMHRDFHSGNVLFDSHNSNYDKNYQWKIGDLGLSQAVNNKSSNNEIYGVVPYIAPEIFRGSGFTKEADIYSLGMIMWEFTTGCKPFDNVKHDHKLIYKILDGERPKITEDTPECYANLMKSCWDPDPKKRPSIKEIRLTFGGWAFRKKNEAEFIQAEAKRKKLIESKKIGPEFAEKRHPEAIYTSRPLSALISKCSSINSSSTISSGNRQGITKKG